MAWYHDEANKQNALEQEAAQKQRVIQQSNFWANLRQQIEADVAGINDTDFWKKRLGGFPVTVYNNSAGDGFGINKAGQPSVLITVRHQGYYVEVIRDLPQDGLEQYASEEQLSIGSSGNEVYVQTESKKRLTVPEEASRYILMPIIDALKITRPSN